MNENENGKGFSFSTLQVAMLCIAVLLVTAVTLFTLSTNGFKLLNIQQPSVNVEVPKPTVTVQVPMNNNYVITNNISDYSLALADGMRRLENDAEKNRKAEEDRKAKDALTAVFLINHVNMIVSKIKNYNDPAVLEEEYRNISQDALRLDVIKDEEIIDLICDIMDVITDLRIDEKEREMLKEELDQGMSDAIYDAISEFNVSGLNPAAMVFSAITSAASAAANYKKAKRRLARQFKKQTWELDKNRMKFLNELNKSLLKKYWAVVQRYNIPDEYRVSEADIALLVDHLKDEDPARRHQFLKAEEHKYKGLQDYWFYRGLSAFECKDRVDVEFALGSFQRAQKNYGQVLRVDGMAAKAAMLRITVMVEKPEYDLDLIRELLSTIERNITIDDWQSHYFCALIYAERLNDLASAERVLLPVINHLEYQRVRRLIDWADLAQDKRENNGTNNVDKLVASGDALYECRSLIAKQSLKLKSREESLEKLNEICARKNASTREKLFCYYAMSYRKALEKLLPDLGKIMVERNNDGVNLLLPMSWVISREGDTCIQTVERDYDLRKFEISNAIANSGEISVMELDEGRYAIMHYNVQKADDIKSVVFSTRYDRGGTNVVSLLVAVKFDLTATGQSRYNSVQAAFGEFVQAGADKYGNARRGGWANPAKVEILPLRKISDTTSGFRTEVEEKMKILDNAYSVIKREDGNWQVYKDGKPTGMIAVDYKDCENWVNDQIINESIK